MIPTEFQFVSNSTFGININWDNQDQPWWWEDQIYRANFRALQCMRKTHGTGLAMKMTMNWLNDDADDCNELATPMRMNLQWWR